MTNEWICRIYKDKCAETRSNDFQRKILMTICRLESREIVDDIYSIRFNQWACQIFFSSKKIVRERKRKINWHKKCLDWNTLKNIVCLLMCDSKWNLEEENNNNQSHREPDRQNVKRVCRCLLMKTEKTTMGKKIERWFFLFLLLSFRQKILRVFLFPPPSRCCFSSEID